MKSNLPIDEAIYEEGYNQAIEEECGWYYNDYDEFEDNPELDEDGYDQYGAKHRGSYPEIVSDTSPHWGIIADFVRCIDGRGLPLKV